MANKTQKFKSVIKGIWNFFVGISNIVSCFVAILSCYIAYTAVSEIFQLNVEISPIIEKLQRDSIVIERAVSVVTPNAVVTPKDTAYIQPDTQTKDLPEIIPNADADSSKYLPRTEMDNIRARRDAFLERMKLFKLFLGKQ